MTIKKTILYTGAFRFPTGDAAAPRVLNNAKILRELGFEVAFISFGGIPQESDKGRDGNYYYQGFRYINTYDIDVRQPNLVKRILRFVFSGRNALGIMNNMFSDVCGVIAYQPSAFFTKQIIKLCEKNNKKLITDLTEWYSSNEFPGGVLAPPAWLNQWNMRCTQKRVKNKIVISSYLNRYYKSSHNIILPPLVDSKEQKWNNFIEVLPLFDGVRIIYAGTPGKKDLLETMLNAIISCVKDGVKLQFVIVGVMKEDIAYYKNMEEVQQFSENILLCGKVPQTLVPSYYHSSDFSLLIRDVNKKSMAGFPTKFVESMMAGCPVILNETSDIGNYVKSGYNGFMMNKFSLQELIKILKSIAEVPLDEIEQMKVNARKSALEKFDYREYVGEMKSFLT